MERTILIDQEESGYSLALLEDGEVVEAFSAQEDEALYGVGNLYLGLVDKVLPGMSAAFVKIGLEKNAFLPFEPDVQAPHAGQALLVQLQKPARGEKGALISQKITLPGRLMVWTPQEKGCALSAKIRDAQERTRLRTLMQELCPPSCGILLRTAAMGATKDALANELELLSSLWNRIARDAQHGRAPALLHRADHPIEGYVRDFLGRDLTRIVVGDAGWHGRIAEALSNWQPSSPPKLELYASEIPLAVTYPVRAAMEKAGRRKVWLPCGGWLVFDRCEAMTVIDVNSGKYVGADTLEDTAFHVNCEAAKEIAKQLRLRDISGIVVIDFIDMRKTVNRNQLLRLIAQLFEADRGKPRVYGDISALGLVQLTRKRTQKE